MKTFSLYIHFPWCLKKCPYCDFNSHTGFTEELENKYIGALIQNFNNSLELINNRQLISIFMGGGTPSLFSAQSIARILENINQYCPFPQNLEITLEANPGTFEINKFSDFAKIGINRLSLGIQSFNDECLQALGRVHNSGEAIKAISHSQNIFNNINLDLIYALPQQSLTMALSDINTACSFSPQHLSAYELTIEPNTYFYKHPPKLADNDSRAQISDEINVLLQSQGYQHYEVSAFAFTNKNGLTSYCQHNLNYWQFGDYLGIGAGAHSKITNNNITYRFEQIKTPDKYINNLTEKNPTNKKFVNKNFEKKTIPPTELPLEFMMNALRLKSGFAKDLFTKQTGINLKTINTQLENAQKLGLINITADKIIPTQIGFQNLNYLLEIFINY